VVAKQHNRVIAGLYYYNSDTYANKFLNW